MRALIASTLARFGLVLQKDIGWISDRLDLEKRRSEELERQRNLWIRRAIAMAGPDDIKQWSPKDNEGRLDMQLPEELS